jgi:hypothetical protein
MVTHQPDLSEGFVHNGQIIYALQYDLENPPPQLCSTLIVWLTPDGESASAMD